MPAHADLFTQVPQVTKLREYLLIADDGLLRLADPAAPPPEPYPGASASATYYTNEAVARELLALRRRSLRRLLDPSIEGRTYGIGSGLSLLPDCVSSVRRVLCFVKPKEEDLLWLQVSGYSTFQADAAGVAKVNAALASSARPASKPYYGPKVKQIAEMYAKYVPPQFVPDQFELAAMGTSGFVRPSVMAMMRTPEENAAIEAAKAAAVAAAEGVAPTAGAAPTAAEAAPPKRRKPPLFKPVATHLACPH